MVSWKAWMGGIALLGVLGCGTDAGDVPEGADDAQELRQLAPETPPVVDMTGLRETETGLGIVDLEVGEGDPAGPGRDVVVHYTGWIQGGEKFDSSIDRLETFSFPLGGGRVIAGWDEGVTGMRVGGKRRLIIPPELGYGVEGRSPVIPGGATLIFDVELLEIGGE